MSRVDLRRAIAVVLLLVSSMVLLGTTGYAQEDGFVLFDEAFYTEMAANKASANGFEYIQGDEMSDLWEKDGLRYCLTYTDGQLADVTLFGSNTDENGQRLFGMVKVIDSTRSVAAASNLIYWTNMADLEKSTNISDIEDELFIELAKEFAENPTEENMLELLERAQ